MAEARRQSQSAPPQKTRKNNAPLPLLFGLLALLLVAGGAIWFFFLRDDSEPGPSPEENGISAEASPPGQIPETIQPLQGRIASGDTHAFALLDDGSLWVWGVYWPTERAPWEPAYPFGPMQIMDNVISVLADDKRDMVITSDDTLWLLSSEDWENPLRLMDNVTYATEGLALLTDGTLWDLHLGDPGRSPSQIMEQVIAVSASSGSLGPQDWGRHALAVTEDGRLWAWGTNTFGQVGDGTTVYRPEPVHLMDNVTAVSAGGVRSFALREDGSLWAWGANWNGMLGDGTIEDRLSPVRVKDEVIAVTAAPWTTYVITADNILWHLGANTMTMLDNVTAVASGGYYWVGKTLALTQDGNLWAWGMLEASEQAGLTPYFTPTIIGNLSTGLTLTLEAAPSLTPGAMPDFRNWSFEEAQMILLEMNLSLNIVRQDLPHDSVTAHFIFETFPAAGEILTEGMTVTLSVSTGPDRDVLLVPNLLAQHVQDAAHALTAIGLSYAVVHVYSTIDRDIFIEQDILPGTEVDPGATVTLTVSMGPDPEAEYE